MDIFSRILDFELSATDTFAMALIASGIITCFFGYRLFKVVLGVTGFVTGGALAWTVLTAAGYGQMVTIAGTLLAALLGGVAMFSLFFAGVFLFGCAMGLLVAVVILSAIGSELNVVVACIFALVNGLVTLWFRKVLIVASTALTGAWSMLSGVAYFVGDLDLVGALSEPELLRTQDGLYYAVLALWFLIGISGIAIQMRTLRKR
ncbi:TMEM198/TM7SF3 family protein [Acidobacteria bacterium AH-259-D05]|nr:TMEM198/TM7SF3 family protein [Acidobacteria bacterium AH-259-D05]